MNRLKAPPRPVRVAVALAFFTYVAAVRTDGIASSFLLLGEQMRDWTLALGSWRDLPLTGTPSTAGGRGLGPIYYWILWIGRHLFGPFTDNLPHAGGLTVSLLQAAGDICLLLALTRVLSAPLALAAALLAATGPFEVGLSAAIWNPPVAAALVKMTMALVLATGARLGTTGSPAGAGGARAQHAPEVATGQAAPSLGRVAAITALAWFAVQAHGSAIFVAAPALAVLAAQPLLLGARRRAAAVGGVLAGTIGVLQVPYLMAHIRAPDARIGPTALLDSFATATTIQPVAAFARVTSITGWLICNAPDSWPSALATFAAAVVAGWRARRDLSLLAVSIGPLATATALFATWTRPYDSYWFLTLAPAMVVTYALAMDYGLRLVADAGWTLRRAVPALSAALLLGVIALQPSRVQASKTFFRYPAYRALVDGSRTIVRRTAVVRELRVDFPVHETTDVQYLYRILGGRVAPDGEFAAIIHADGSVTFTRP